MTTTHERIVAALSGDQSVNLEVRLRKHGLAMEDYVEAVKDPQVVQAIMDHCRNVHLVAALPATLSSLSERATNGDARAQEQVLGLFSEKSPLREFLSLRPETMTDEGIRKALGSLIDRMSNLKEKMDEADGSGAVGAPGDAGDGVRPDEGGLGYRSA